MIELVCDKNRAFFRETEKLTSGSIGVTINFVFSPEWDGLLKTAVFEAGDVKNNVVLTADSCEIPPDVLACPDKQLFVGVFGELADKTLVIPTIYAEAGIIRPGASPSGMTSAPPSPSWPEQVQAIALEAKEVADSVRSDADAGKFNGPAGGWYAPEVTQPDENTMRFSFTPSKEGMPAVPPKDITIPGGGGGSGEAGGYYAPNVDDDGNLSWTASKTDMPAVDGANIKGSKGDTGATGPQGPQGIQGETGPQGPAGADGKSAYAYAAEGGYTGTEAEFAAKLAAEKFVNPYALTFTGAATGSYDGSEALTVNIPSGGGGGETAETWVKIGDYTWTAEDAAATTVPQIVYDTDAAGNPLSIDAVFLRIYTLASATRTLYLLMDNGNGNINYIAAVDSFLVNNNYQLLFCELKQNPIPHGLWKAASGVNAHGGGAGKFRIWSPTNVDRYFKFPANGVSFFPSAQILEGSTFEIWGRVANV